MPERPRPYELIAATIRYLDANAGQQPSLAELASRFGLSEFHLQRLFAEWAGVSPKRFLQYLTKEHAKRVLRASASVLDASLESGLSGPGRLHDLLVNCDAVSPGEVGAAGDGLSIHWGIAPTPFGDALIAATARGVCRVDFIDGAPETALAALHAEWPRARTERDDAAAAVVAGRMFASAAAEHTITAAAVAAANGTIAPATALNPTIAPAAALNPTIAPAAAFARPLHLLLKGTNFQIQVWQALLRLPAGSLTSYGELARAVGRPEAARAVGTAIGRNALAVLIPCHRVIRESGALGGYRWGIERKQALIARESAQAEARA